MRRPGKERTLPQVGPQRHHSRQVGSGHGQLFPDDPQEKHEEFSLGPSRSPEATAQQEEPTTTPAHTENDDAEEPVVSGNQEKEDTVSLDVLW